MTPSFHVVVGTFGDDRWKDLASERAIPSIEAAISRSDYRVTVKTVHATSLQDARNKGAEVAPSKSWLIFVDADDTLDVNYIQAMGDKVSTLHSTNFIVQPSTRTVRAGKRVDQPILIQPKESILAGNHCVIGSAVNIETFNNAGGFGSDPFWEDWVLWIDCWFAGAEFTTCQDAIYEVWQSPDSRNKVSDRAAQSLFRQVVGRYRGKVRRQN